MPLFLASSFLIGLVGLSIPILVHLWNTKDSKVIKVGSIRFLQESDAVKVNRIHFSEIPLMLLRLLILLVLVLLLSDMRFEFLKSTDAEVKWVLLEPSVSSQPALLDTIEILVERGWQTRYLAPDFPLLTDGLDSSYTINIWSLLKQLDLSSNSPDSLLVLSTLNWSGFNGNRPRLGIPVDWIKVPMSDSKHYPVLALDRSDSIMIYQAFNDGYNVELSRSDVPYKVVGVSPSQAIINSSDNLKLAVQQLDTSKITINGDPESIAYQNLVAALDAVKVLNGQPMTVADFSDPQIVFNLVVTDQKGSGLTLNYLPEKMTSEMLVPDVRQLNTYLITKPLAVDQIMTHDFVQSLYHVITESFEYEVIRNSNMALPLNTIRPAFYKSAHQELSPALASLQLPLWILLMILIGAERVLSHRRKQ